MALKEGRYAQAATALRPLHAEQPDNAMLLEALGRSYLALGLRWMAARSFERIVVMYPLDHYAHYCLGRAYESMGTGFERDALHHYTMATLLWDGPHYRLRRELFVWNLTATAGSDER
jgi:predicted Zn-dependent protease